MTAAPRWWCPHHRRYETDDDLTTGDLFAGFGGASIGVEGGTGKPVGFAINHSPTAIAVHQANHRQTRHIITDIFSKESHPRLVVGKRHVTDLWASPDCTDHSNAKGGVPIRESGKDTRCLAWVVVQWAREVRPDRIYLENVPEFEKWGPLIKVGRKFKRDPERLGETFMQFVGALELLGYAVEWRAQYACDFGAPTRRKRLFMVARCDGEPIVWPEPTHGPGLLPYRTAAECIDWSIPCPSIFELCAYQAQQLLKAYEETFGALKRAWDRESRKGRVVGKARKKLRAMAKGGTAGNPGALRDQLEGLANKKGAAGSVVVDPYGDKPIPVQPRAAAPRRRRAPAPRGAGRWAWSAGCPRAPRGTRRSRAPRCRCRSRPRCTRPPR